MSPYKRIVRPILFRLFEAEQAHDFAWLFLRLTPRVRAKPAPALASKVAGLEFESPVGMAAGFDKEAEFFELLYRFAFGSVEVGTFTLRPQAGNPKPRIFRVPEAEAIINWMGFPNCGLKVALKRLKSFKKLPGRPLGVNVGANKESVDRVSDYRRCYQLVASIADYVAINVSSPNTPGLRSLEVGDNLQALLSALDCDIDEHKTPIFLKVSPDLSRDQVAETCSIALSSRISGIIVGNTTVTRPSSLQLSEGLATKGGLSGAPLRRLSENALDSFYEELQGRLPIISVGGISSADEVYDRIKRGANLVQIYTAFIYDGPYVVEKINSDLNRLLMADGYNSISEAIGAEHQTRRSKMSSPVGICRPTGGALIATATA